MAYALAFRPESSAVAKRTDPPALYVIENDAFAVDDEPDVVEFLDTAQPELSPDAAMHGSIAAKPQTSTSKWYRKLAISCGFHAAFALLLVGFVTDEVLIAGSEDTMAALLGDGSVDMNASGIPDPVNPEAMNVSLVAMVMPKPVPAKEVEKVAPVEANEPAETIAPVESSPADVDPAPTEVSEVPPSEAPEILAVTPLQPTLDENVVQQPSKATVQPVEDEEPLAKSVEKSAAQKPATTKPTAEKRAAEKPQEPAKKATPAAKVTKAPVAKAASGREGSNERTARSGIADGKNDGQKNADGNTRGKSSAQGNAAVSNYPGTVTSKLRRALRRGRLRGEVLVSFVVASNGSVTGVGIGRSSGIAAVDKAGMDTVRRAAPFPPIPADAGRSTWAFNVPLAFGG
jgi:protein TonB